MAVQGFAGVDYSTKDRSSGPVQFERDPAEAVEADPFGLDQIISEVSGLLPLYAPVCLYPRHVRMEHGLFMLLKIPGLALPGSGSVDA